MASNSIHKAVHHIHESERKVRPPWVAAGLTLAAAAAGLGVWLLLSGGEDSDDPAEKLTAQMRAAADGRAVPAVHALGGRLDVQFAGPKTAVIAYGLPAKICVQAGWRLSKSGTVIVGGVLAQRLSAAKLSELCEGGADVMWVPE